MQKFITAGILVLLLTGIASAGTSYVHGPNGLIAKINETNITYYHSDHLGSTSAITNEKGEVIEEQKNLPFGELLEGSEEYGFTGKELDETDLQYFGARYYNPAVGKFLTTDPALQGFASYGYAGGNPLTNIDPDGRFFKKLGGFFKGREELSQREVLDKIYSSFSKARDQKRGELVFNTDPELNEGVSAKKLERMEAVVTNFVYSDIFKKKVVDLSKPENAKHGLPILVVFTNNRNIIRESVGGGFPFSSNKNGISFFCIIINSDYNEGFHSTSGSEWESFLDDESNLELNTAHEFTHLVSIVIEGKYKEWAAYRELSEKKKEIFRKKDPEGYALVSQQYDEFEATGYNVQINLAPDVIRHMILRKAYTEKVKKIADEQRRKDTIK